MNNTFYIGVFEIRKFKIINICDSNLIGKKFVKKLENDETQVLDINKNLFTAEQEITEEFLKTLKEQPNLIVYAIGSEICNILLNEEIVGEEDIRYIASVPYVMFFNVKE